MTLSQTNSNKSTNEASSPKKSLTDIEESKMWIYETGSQQTKIVRKEDLQTSYKSQSIFTKIQLRSAKNAILSGSHAAEPSFIPIKVHAGRKHVDVILPENKERGLGSMQIASVTVPWSVFMRTSVMRQETSLYITSKC